MGPKNRTEPSSRDVTWQRTLTFIYWHTDRWDNQRNEFIFVRSHAKTEILFHEWMKEWKERKGNQQRTKRSSHKARTILALALCKKHSHSHPSDVTWRDANVLLILRQRQLPSNQVKSSLTLFDIIAAWGAGYRWLTLIHGWMDRDRDLEDWLWWFGTTRHGTTQYDTTRQWDSRIPFHFIPFQ